MYIGPFPGGGAIMRRRPPARRSIGVDPDRRAVDGFRCGYPVELHQGCALRFPGTFPFQGREPVYRDPPYLQATRRSGRRYRHDIVSGAGGRRVDAGARECPGCRARTGGRFPDGMPGPLRYGAGLQAFTVNPPVAHMPSLRRAVAPGQAVSGPRLSGATCPGRVRRPDGAPMSWEAAAAAHLPERPAPHADGTGLRAGGRTEWLHVPPTGPWP